MRDKVLDTIRKNDLLGQGDRVSVGLSGGADSVALLCVLLELEDELKITVSAVHVNHMLRGAESDSDEEFCRKLCERLKVPFKAARVDVPSYCAENGLSDEEGARILRYRALEELSNGLIATAHHSDDNAETVLLNLVRGTSLDGLCGIPVKRGNIVRPLLSCTRCEIEEYLAKRGQPYCTDSTNELDIASRNKLRHGVIPILKEINPAFLKANERMTLSLREDREYLDNISDALYDSAVFGHLIDRAKYTEAARPLRMRVMRKFLRKYKIPVDSDKLRACDELLSCGEGSRTLAPKIIFTIDEDKAEIVFKESEAEPFSALTVLPRETGEEVIVKAGAKTLSIRRISGKEIKLFVNYRRKQFKNVIDCDKILKSVVLRSRREGDSIRLCGRKCSKTVKKLLNEAKIPPDERNSIIAMQSGNKLVWLEGFGVSEFAAADKKTVNAVLLTVDKKEK